VLGEDSGIEVDGLGGGPGSPLAQRSAATRSAGCCTRSGASTATDDERATCRSSSAIGPDGDGAPRHGHAWRAHRHGGERTEGFGFDPVFVPDGEQRTVAELGDEWKAQHSHRARTLRARRSYAQTG
jgi:XTP/dITP diphosphohydrolase